MKHLSKNLSISLKKEDEIYGEMVEAVAAFYQAKGETDRGSASRIIVSLLRKYVPPMIQEIKERYGVDPLEIYQEYMSTRIPMKAFFSGRINQTSKVSKLIEEKLDEYWESKK